MVDDDYPYASRPDAKIWQPPWSAARSGGDLPLVLPPDSPPREGPSLAVIVACVVPVLAIANFTMAPVASSIQPGPGEIVGAIYLLLVLGAIGAQAAVLSIYLVWGEGPLWQRLAWHWAVAAVALFAWCFGFALAEASWVFTDNFPKRELLALVCGLPVISLACQAVPWLFRYYFRWRIEIPGAAPRADGSERLAIRDIIVGTVLTAVTMAIFRLGKPDDVDDSFFWAAWGIGCAFAAGVSLICVLPIIYLTLAVQRVGWGTAGVIAMTALMVVIACVVLTRVAPGGPSDRERIAIVVSLACGSAGSLTATLLIARAFGYRLVTEHWTKPRPVVGVMGESPFL
jgi:hypothetical protein